MSRTLKFILIITIQYLSLSVFAVDFNGVIELTEKGKPADKSEYEDTVVYFVPNNVVSNDSLTTEIKDMKMEKKTFSPRVLPVTTGSTVNFPNFDPILHNAFSTSTNNNFDLGLYSDGENGSKVFEKSGLVRVYCNVHHAMVAYILVFDNAFFTKIDGNGNFKLAGLPDTSGTLFIWHPRARVIKKEVNTNALKAGETFTLNLSKRRIPKHKNKSGKSYRKLKKRDY